MEPTKHQYDYDAAAVHAFLRRYGLEKEIKLNIEANHATLAGHSFQHELAYAIANGLFGSVDVNRGDPQLGWDTDQFPNNVRELDAGALHHPARRRLHHRRVQLRRQAAPADDRPGRPVPRPHRRDGRRGPRPARRGAHDRGRQPREPSQERYAGWRTALGRDILEGRSSLQALSDRVLASDADPEPGSGRQEYLENLVNRFC